MKNTDGKRIKLAEQGREGEDEEENRQEENEREGDASWVRRNRISDEWV